MTGASNVNTDVAVPTSDCMVTDASLLNPVPADNRHLTSEIVVQEVVPHAVEPILTDGVISGYCAPKLNPVSVRLVPPHEGALDENTCVTTGESKVNADMCVPTRPVRVTTDRTFDAEVP
jgi:hypothetical protein